MGILKSILAFLSRDISGKVAVQTPALFDYELVSAYEPDKGGGYYVRRNSDQKILSWRGLPKGLESFGVTGISFYRGKDPYVDPGVPVRLIREPKNKHDRNAVAVIDVYDVQAGYVPATRALEIGARLQAEQYEYFISVWTREWDDKLVDIRVLLVGKGASLGVPALTNRLIKKHSR